MTNYAQTIATHLNVRTDQVGAVIKLMEEGNTLPFIARYRKEMTGALDEVQIREIQDQLEHLKSLDERREVILESIESQGKLTPELKEKILQTDSKTELEDLYLPYRPKRRTRASIARERGLEGLAAIIKEQPRGGASLEKRVQPFLTPDVPTVEDALAGARDIIAEEISDHADIRQRVREKALHWGLLRSEKVEGADDPKQVYERYYQFTCKVEALRHHQVLAIERGENEKVLRVSLEVAETDWKRTIGTFYRADRSSPFTDHLLMAIDDGAQRLLLPAIEREVRRMLFEKAEEHAIGVFASNLRALLFQPPLVGRVVLGLDPGYRTGCKVAVVDATGKVLQTATIYPHEPKNDWTGSLKILGALVARYQVSLISIGNGTASRETERLAADLIKNCPGVAYVITNEAGASVYSASKLAGAELPDMDVTLRGAVSIARRVQDPLAELVKIDPKSIGVGLYQHDVNQTLLAKALDGVVESVVNQVGVDLNTASPALLQYVSGVGPKLATTIVAHREANGPFKNRQAVKKVTGFGPKAFEQAAGFLRIFGGDQPLDASAIHPESYATAEKVLSLSGYSKQLTKAEQHAALERLKRDRPIKDLANELNVGVPTLEDIFEQLLRPGRDPRMDAPAPILRSDVLKMEDLVTGMRLKGTVRNVVDFGAFVDIGVKQDGLLHRSRIPSGTHLAVGDQIDVVILGVEIDRGRVSLGMPNGESE